MPQQSRGRVNAIQFGWLLAGACCWATATAATMTVNTLADELNSNGNCSLREALRAANTTILIDACPLGSTSVTDVVVLQSGARYTLTRVGEDDIGVFGDLDIADDVILLGNGATIDGNGAVTQDRVLSVQNGSIVAISNLTVTDGRASSGSGIRSFGTLTLTGVSVVGNVGLDDAGGILVSGNNSSATLVDTTISNNVGPNRGGGLMVFGSARVDLIDSELVGNEAGILGGGIYNEGTLNLLRTRVSANQAGASGGSVQTGGGIYNAGILSVSDSSITSNAADDSAGLINDGGTLTLIGSTISGNSAVSVGGLRNTNNAVANLVNSTISGNVASGSAGGLANSAGGSVQLSNVTIAFNTTDADANGSGDGGGLSNAATLTARNSVIANNLDGSPAGSNSPDCAGTLVSAGAVLLGNTTGCSTSGGSVLINSDSGLLALADNGGPTFTHAFAAGARVHEAGVAAGCRDHNNNPITHDQRGTARPQGARCDIGALEFDNSVPVVVSVTRLDGNPTQAASVRFLVTFSEAVSGVDAPNDFALVQSGVSNAAVTQVVSAGDHLTHTVTVSTGTGGGSLRMNVIDNNSIADFAGNGIVGGFTGGETYSIDRPLFASGFE